MIDLQLLDKGQPYSKLNKSFIIFICLSDLFGRGRHRYTFENICKEEPTLFLGDGTAKIFLNTEGELEDVKGELKAFLDYVAGKPSEDEYVQKLEKAVRQAKENRKWRHEYMTLLMRDQENIERGREEGREEGIYTMISTLCELNIPEEVILKKLQEKYHMTLEGAYGYLKKAL